VTTLAFDLAARTRAALAWWMLGILGMAAYAVTTFDTISGREELSRLYEQYPPAIRKLFGEVDIGSLNGWIQVEIVSYIPLLLAIYAGIFAAGSLSREVEQRTVDFILGLPVSRTRFILSRLVVGLWNILLICVGLFAVLVAGVAIIGHTPSAGNYALALTNAFLLGAALLAAYIAVASAIDEQARVTGITLGLTLGAYVLTGAFKATDAPEVLRWLLPFEHYHSAQAMTQGSLPIAPLVLLISTTLAASGFAVYWYNRRDIAI
jgi:ABC-2 type transport system permease protein